MWICAGVLYPLLQAPEQFDCGGERDDTGDQYAGNGVLCDDSSAEAVKAMHMRSTMMCHCGGAILLLARDAPK